MVFGAEQPENDGFGQKTHWPRMAISQLKCREFDSRGKRTGKMDQQEMPGIYPRNDKGRMRASTFSLFSSCQRFITDVLA